MKKVLTILSVLLALSASAQNTHKQSNSNTNEEFQGSVEAKVGFINAHFTDTSAANRAWIKNRPFAQITTGQGSFWLRDATATRWIGTGNATINISPDSSSLIICNGIGSCDTIPVAPVAPITNFTVISDTSIVVCGVNSCDTVYTLPINYNQNVVNRVSVVNGVAIDSVFYFINGLKYLAGTIKNAGTQGSILNDSTFLLCNSNSCDTFIVRNIKISSFSFTSDSTVSVCNTAGSCDTITFNPIPLGKFFVDSTKIVPGAVDTLFYWINGVKYIGGFINHLSTVNDGIISGGIVTYSGSGLTYYVSAATYVIGGEFYSSPDTTITLDAADATNPRIDLFAVDTLGHVLKITGIAASTPLTPQVDVSQLALTTGITLAPNATQPTGTSSTLIYDENTEWTTGGTATINFNNTTNPYHGTKDALVSAYSKSSTLTFTGTTQTVNGQVLRAFINLLNSNYSFQFRFYNGTTAVSNALTLNGFGFNPTLYNTYQNVSIPLSSFTWSGNAFDKLVITMTGKGATGTYYIDYISLESGTPVVAPPTDYSNKVDSVTTVNGSIYYWVKGMSHLVGTASGGTTSGIDSASYHTLTVNSDTTGATLNRPNGTSDFIPLPFVKKTDTTVIKVHYPLWAFTSDSLGLRTDSMPKLEYAIAGRDTSTWDNQTLIDKQFLQDRISTITATGITRTELQDTAAAIRGGIPAATDTTSLSNRINQKLNISDTASMLSPYAKTADVPAQFNPISGTNITLSGTYPNITFNSTASGSGVNIYNRDSSLTGNRHIDLNTHKLSFTNGNVIIGDTTDDGHRLRVNGTIEFNIGSDAPGDIYYRDSLWNFTRLAAPTGITKPVLGFANGYPKWQADSTGGGTNPTLSTLTDAGTITWNYLTQGTEAKVTLGGNRTLSITNLPTTVTYFTLTVIQDATGTRTLTLPVGTKVINSGAGVVTLSTAANAQDILSFRWDGTTLFCTYGKSYN